MASGAPPRAQHASDCHGERGGKRERGREEEKIRVLVLLQKAKFNCRLGHQRANSGFFYLVSHCQRESWYTSCGSSRHIVHVHGLSLHVSVYTSMTDLPIRRQNDGITDSCRSVYELCTGGGGGSRWAGGIRGWGLGGYRPELGDWPTHAAGHHIWHLADHFGPGPATARGDALIGQVTRSHRGELKNQSSCRL